MTTSLGLPVRPILVPLLVGTAILAAGCRSADVTSNKRIIGVSLLSLANPFFTEIADGLREDAAKHGYEVIVVSADNDVALQDKQVRDFLVRRADAIVLSPCDSKGIGESVRAANAAGVPVFTVDIACLAPNAEV